MARFPWRVMKFLRRPPMHELDVALTRTINGWAGGGGAMDHLMIWVSASGVPLLVVAIAGQWWRRGERRHRRHILVAVGLSFLLGLALNQSILLFVHRTRPYDTGITHLLIARSLTSRFPPITPQQRLCHCGEPALLWHAAPGPRVSRGRVPRRLLSHLRRHTLQRRRSRRGHDRVGAGALVPSLYSEGSRIDRLITGIL